MILIYIGSVLMTFGNLGIICCLTTGYNGFFYYMSLGFLPIGMTLLGYGVDFVHRKIKTMEDSIEDLNRKVDITATTLWSHKRCTHGEDI